MLDGTRPRRATTDLFSSCKTRSTWLSWQVIYSTIFLRITLFPCLNSILFLKTKLAVTQCNFRPQPSRNRVAKQYARRCIAGLLHDVTTLRLWLQSFVATILCDSGMLHAAVIHATHFAMPLQELQKKDSSCNTAPLENLYGIISEACSVCNWRLASLLGV